MLIEKRRQLNFDNGFIQQILKQNFFKQLFP